MIELEVIEIASAMVIALAGGMVILWKGHNALEAKHVSSLNNRIQHTEDKLANCEEQHLEAMQSIIFLSERVGNLEGFAQQKHGDFIR